MVLIEPGPERELSWQRWIGQKLLTIQCYYRRLRNRHYCWSHRSSVEFRLQTSKLRQIKKGVPSGGVLSSLLFYYYIVNVPSLPERVSLISYADDFIIVSSVEFRLQISKLRKVKQGVPYDGVLSRLLFFCYIFKVSSLISYVDDCSI